MVVPAPQLASLGLEAVIAQLRQELSDAIKGLDSRVQSLHTKVMKIEGTITGKAPSAAITGNAPSGAANALEASIRSVLKEGPCGLQYLNAKGFVKKYNEFNTTSVKFKDWLCTLTDIMLTRSSEASHGGWEVALKGASRKNATKQTTNDLPAVFFSQGIVAGNKKNGVKHGEFQCVLCNAGPFLPSSYQALVSHLASKKHQNALETLDARDEHVKQDSRDKGDPLAASDPWAASAPVRSKSCGVLRNGGGRAHPAAMRPLEDPLANADPWAAAAAGRLKSQECPARDDWPSWHAVSCSEESTLANTILGQNDARHSTLSSSPLLADGIQSPRPEEPTGVLRILSHHIWTERGVQHLQSNAVWEAWGSPLAGESVSAEHERFIAAENATVTALLSLGLLEVAAVDEQSAPSATQSDGATSDGI